MSSPAASTVSAVRRRQRHAHEARRRRLALLIVLAVVAVATLVVTAFGGGGESARLATPASASRLLPAGPPTPQVVARLGALRLQLPVNQTRVTAIGYFAGGEGVLPLTPAGAQANEGLLKRLVHVVVGGGSGSLRWYQLPGGTGSPTSGLDVGAAPGTDVYAPVDGTIIGIGKLVLDGRVYGRRIDIQPTAAPSLVVSVSRIRPDPSLAVGSVVAATTSKLGKVLDLSQVEEQALARYTNDAGNHVLIQVRPAAAIQAR